MNDQNIGRPTGDEASAPPGGDAGTDERPADTPEHGPERSPSGGQKAPRRRKGPFRLLGRTLNKAWEGNIFSEAAEAAFWQTLSLPPLLLGLLGSIGYIGDWFGQQVVTRVHDNIIGFADTIFSDSVVQRIIEPTVNDILTTGKGEIVSVGFLISLWAGSSAMSSFVDAITVAHDQYGVRNEVWQRIFALLLYMASLALLIVGLPIIAIGPDLLPDFFPPEWRPTVSTWVGTLYYPTAGVALVLALATLYKLSLPRKLPWHRGLPGAVLAMVIFLLSSVGLRLYIGWITTTGYTYGALATPIAFLLFAFFIGLAIVAGAYFNSAIQELWPAKPTRRQRRAWQRLERERAAEHIKADENRPLASRTTLPLRRKPSRQPGPSRDPRSTPREGTTQEHTAHEGPAHRGTAHDAVPPNDAAHNDPGHNDPGRSGPAQGGPAQGDAVRDTAPQDDRAADA
ncbi:MULTISPECIES: YihY/virulence factor BrkB family protein [Prauserella salsuginis group]|uniref:YihY/virulence factor BrkB family protein n=1 Tax=Prauserella salsuginis TaxID=387889 RepID=A0ABW6G2X6_9PSEU|nr:MULTISPECIES: YihY/virulence factor BrkB family protein [Prauserella salsuginis group]MCR3718430.1 membrane protein [Prauserella flava]MCR3733000.1 membrane protein [Prauserella salsuginis]